MSNAQFAIRNYNIEKLAKHYESCKYQRDGYREHESQVNDPYKFYELKEPTNYQSEG